MNMLSWFSKIGVILSMFVSLRRSNIQLNRASEINTRKTVKWETCVSVKFGETVSNLLFLAFFLYRRQANISFNKFKSKSIQPNMFTLLIDILMARSTVKPRFCILFVIIRHYLGNIQVRYNLFLSPQRLWLKHLLALLARNLADLFSKEMDKD